MAGQLLADPTVHEIEGTRTLLVHGDTLCTDDLDYQNWRRHARSESWQREFLARPRAERRRLIAEGSAPRIAATDLSRPASTVPNSFPPSRLTLTIQPERNVPSAIGTINRLSSPGKSAPSSVSATRFRTSGFDQSKFSNRAINRAIQARGEIGVLRACEELLPPSG